MSISCLFQTLHVYLFVEKKYSPFHFVTFIVFPSILVLCTYQRKSALDEEDNDNQHNRENAENCKVEMLTQPLKKNKNMIYQGMYENHKNCLLIYKVYEFN